MEELMNQIPPIKFWLTFDMTKHLYFACKSKYHPAVIIPAEWIDIPGLIMD